MKKKKKPIRAKILRQSDVQFTSYSGFSDATFVIFKTMEKSEFRVCPSRQMVKKWFADFKRGRTNTDDAEHSVRSNSAGVSENMKKSTKWFWPISNRSFIR